MIGKKKKAIFKGWCIPTSNACNHEVISLEAITKYVLNLFASFKKIGYKLHIVKNYQS